jgi:hypothetical protein
MTGPSPRSAFLVPRDIGVAASKRQSYLYGVGGRPSPSPWATDAKALDTRSPEWNTVSILPSVISNIE